MGQLDNKVALVLGASSTGGFGEAIARRFAAEGAKVVVSARSKQSLDVIASEINGIAVTCDITDESQLQRMVAETVNACGQLDIAVCVPGGHLSKPVAELSKELIQPLCDMNITGPALFIKHCAASMPDGGSIIILSSLAADVHRFGTAIYGATKAATEKLAAIAAVEYGPVGIKINCISPGMVMTPMATAFNRPHIIKVFEEQTPMRKLASPENVAEAALYLASDNCLTTGDVMRVGGGAHLTRMPTSEELNAAAPSDQGTLA
jgi:NAD(P)-dependent dehydrogenase (short-subunit alcohol dehydrogenase family)